MCVCVVVVVVGGEMASKQARPSSGVAMFENPLTDGASSFDFETNPSPAGLARPGVSVDTSEYAEEEENDDALGVMTIAKFGVSLGLNVTKGTLGTLQTLGPMGGSPRAQGTSTSREDLRVVFDQIDIDGGGTLDLPEVRELIHGLGVHLTEAELTATVVEMISSVRPTYAEPSSFALSRIYNVFLSLARSLTRRPRSVCPIMTMQNGEKAKVTEHSDALQVTFDQFADWWMTQVEAKGDSGGSSKLAKILRGFDVDVQEEERALKRLTYLHPDQMFKRAWDSYIIMVLLYVGVTLPYRIAFEASAHDAYYVIAVVYELSLIADVFVNMRTAYHDIENAVLITGTWPMLKHYMWVRFGWMDVISSFPFQTLRVDTDPNLSGNIKLLQMLRLCQVTRIAKVIRAIKGLQQAFFKLVNDTLGRLTVSVSVYTMRMTKLCTLLLTSAHLTACIWCAGHDSRQHVYPHTHASHSCLRCGGFFSRTAFGNNRNLSWLNIHCCSPGTS